MISDNGIFIIGCQRSGTTLLRMILDAHPQICSGEETGFLQDLEHMTGNRWHHLATYGFTRKAVLQEIKDFYLKFQHELCSKTGKTIWIDKTPYYYDQISFIRELFPEAKFIFIYRDGRDVAASCREKWGKIGFYKCIREWKRSFKIIENLEGENTNDIYKLKYEDLVTNPRLHLQELLSFLNIAWDDALLNHSDYSHLTSDTYGFERPLQAINTNSLQTWKKRLNIREKFIVKFALRSYLEQKNYIKKSRMNMKLAETIVFFFTILHLEFLLLRQRI
jgi:hypothetical protein